ncbi:MAG: hypothetical protein ACO1SV_01460 [Fimbriimonas sp.]
MMLVPLLLLAPAEWRATFVPLHRAFLYNHLAVYDARRDRSAVGSSFEHGTDWHTEAPVVVHRGRVLPTKDGEKWLPVAFRGEDIVTQQVKRMSSEKPVFRLASFLPSGLRWKTQVGARQLPKPKRVEASPYQDTIPFRDEWMRPLYPKTKDYGPEDTLSVTWYRLRSGVEVGSGRYHLGPSDMKYMYAYDDFPLVRTGGKITALKDRTRVQKGVRLTQVLFVSPEGWFVMEALRDGEKGLAWVEPVR